MITPAGSMQRRVNNPQRFRLANHTRVEDQRFEPVHVSLVDILSDHGHFTLLLLRKRRERLGRDRVYFGDDSAGVWFDHLGAVVEINFVAIVVRRVVAGGDYDPCAGVQMTNGKRKLRHRTRSIEHKGVATIFGCDLRRQPGEFFREKSRIMRDHKFWLRRTSLTPVPVLQVGDKSSRCTINVKKIHRVRADAGKFRSLVLPARSRVPHL